MNLYLHKLKKNWLPLVLAILVVVFAWGVRTCGEAKYKKDIKELDEEIFGLKKDNVKLEDEAVDYVAEAEVYKKAVAKKEANIEKSRLIILELRKKRETIVAEVMELPPSRLVEEFREILDCVQVELEEDGILFSIGCSQKALAMIAQFSLIKEEIEQTGFSLSEYGGALQSQKMVSWNLYGALWKLGGVVLNLRIIVKKQDIKFAKSEKQKRKSWWNGLKIGLAIGGGLTITIGIIIPAIKAIF